MNYIQALTLLRIVLRWIVRLQNGIRITSQEVEEAAREVARKEGSLT